MSRMDVEMEDPEKLPDESGNNLQEPKSAKVESEVEKSSCISEVSGDVSERDNGGEDLNKCRTDQPELRSEVKDQIDPKSEANEPIEGTESGNISIKSGSEEPINNVTNAEEQTALISPMEKQIDADNVVVAEKDNNGGLEEKMSAEDGGEGGDCHPNEEKIPEENVAEKKPNDIGKEDVDCAEHVVGGHLATGNADAGDNPRENNHPPTDNKGPQTQDGQSDEVRQDEDEEMEDAVKFDEDKTIKDTEQSRETDSIDKTVETSAKSAGEESPLASQHEAAKSKFLNSCSSAKAEDHNREIANTFFTQSTLSLTGEGDDGTPEDQTAFMRELESFYREKAMDFKPPKFYGQPLNCLKLWRAVIRLGGYDKVTGSKLWRQVGESFHPPKTCTTVSWTFRIFYEKSLLEYERHKTLSGELQLPIATLPEVTGVDMEGNGYHGSGSGRARRDSAARAMQGWHAQRLSDSREDKSPSNTAKPEKNLKSIVSLKQKRPNEVEHSSKAARIELSKQVVTSVVDIGPPADWVKINVRQNKDCFEVYALVPGLLREEVRVQSDPAGRVVITGQPEQADNPWGITPFKKVVSLPARIDPVQTSAVVSLHGRLFVRVPFEQQSNT